MSYDQKYLKTNWLDTKAEGWVFINNVSMECIKKIVPIATKNYFSGYHMEEYFHDITMKIHQHKK